MLAPRPARGVGIKSLSSSSGLPGRALSVFRPTRGVHLPAHGINRKLQVCAALDPYKTLGVKAGADEKDIKRAHRKLVLKYHPDLAKGTDGVEVKFLAIQEAYEILIGKRRGKEVDSGPASGWDFHDWYWQFSMKRRKGSAGATAGPPPPEVSRATWRTQMSGLKAKAAAKKAAARAGAGTRGAHAASNSDGARQPSRPSNPTEAAASSVWRSTTKNARTSQTSSVEFKKTEEFFADPLSQQSVAAAAGAPKKKGVPPTVFAARQHEQQPLVAEEEKKPVPLHHAVASAVPEEPSFASAFASVSASSPEGDNQHTTASPTDQASVDFTLRRLLTKAVHAMQTAHQQHQEHSHAVLSSHAQRIQSHIASIGEKLSIRLQLHAFHNLSTLHNNEFAMNGGQHEEGAGRWRRPIAGFESPLQWRGFSPRGTAGVPNEDDLRMLFGDAVRSMHSSSSSNDLGMQVPFGPTQHTEASGGAEFACNAGAGEYSYPRGDAHSRKFADRQHVQSRLSHQLTGLKRRAAFKQELQQDE